jgi:hypothetical protein
MQLTKTDLLSKYPDADIYVDRFDPETHRRLWTTTTELVTIVVEKPEAEKLHSYQTIIGKCLKPLGWTRNTHRIPPNKHAKTHETRYYSPAGIFNDSEDV